MAETLNPDAVPDMLKSLRRPIAQGSVDQMRKLAEHQQARAVRQAAIAERLAAKLGDKHERVQAVRHAGERGRQIAAHFSRALSKIEAAGAARPGGLLFSGRVLDAAGNPQKGVTVRLSDRTGALEVPGAAVADDLGEFTLVVAPESVDIDAADLALVVEDAQKRIAGVSAGPLRVQPDVWQRIDLTAAKPARPPRGTSAGRRRATKSRRPRKTDKQ